jgi:L-asparagine transporter-like permease
MATQPDMRTTVVLIPPWVAVLWLGWRIKQAKTAAKN